VLVFKDVARQFLEHLKGTIVQFYGEDPQKSPDYGRIITTRHVDRLAALLSSGTIYHGGKVDRADRFIAPTVLVNVSPASPVMQEEIFGPILPFWRSRASRKWSTSSTRGRAHWVCTCSPKIRE
jgi:aldehyde dehydrogenase (NAD+)